ncbi:MAG TPA: HAD family phosphatase [Gemmatimonadaceae bacterium]|nr:HAD family phosphatase [Gemmatimonadaceae bacterium]
MKTVTAPATSRPQPGSTLAIRAALFDLDGTLVATERLKAQSYARAAVMLRPDSLKPEEVVAAYDDLVGRPREQVVHALMERFALEAPARGRMAELGAQSPADAFLTLRLTIYNGMLGDHALVRRNEFPETVALLRHVKGEGYRTGIATMSHAEQAVAVLEILGIRRELDAVVTREEVERPKPDPQIYLVLAERLELPGAACLVIEDSLPGIRAALAAGMTCVAATTELTRDSVHASGVLSPERIVDDRAQLGAVIFPLLTGRAHGPA